MDNYALGLDVGGSSVKHALLRFTTAEPQVIETGLDPLDPSRSPSSTMAVLADVTRRYRGQASITTIGIGLPGMFDAREGRPTLLPNFPTSWMGYPFRSTAEHRLGQPVTVVNDAKAFSVAESTVGAARGRTCVACVVLGTGVGGGLMIGGELWSGTGTAGEFGHLTVDLDGPRCGCGNHGCVESYAGAAAIATAAGTSSVEEAFARAETDDPRAVAAVAQAVRALGAALANVFIATAPDVFVIGGGIAAAGERLVNPLTEEIRRRVRVADPAAIQVVTATLGRHAGAIGAAIMGHSAAGELASTVKTASIT